MRLVHALIFLTNLTLQASRTVGDQEIQRLPVQKHVAGFGAAICAIADVNGDAVADFLVGAPSDRQGYSKRSLSDRSRFASRGTVWLISGQRLEPIYGLLGTEPDCRFGSSIVTAGDLDTDGVADYLVGSPGVSPGSGRVEAFSGKSGQRLFTIAAPKDSSRFGQTLATVRSDKSSRILLVGAPGAATPGGDAGTVMAIELSSRRELWVRKGSSAGDGFGTSISVIEEPDSANADKLIVGAPSWRENGSGMPVGSASVCNVNTGEIVRTYAGKEDASEFGYSVLGLRDLNNDGRAEFAVGAPKGGAYQAGCVYIFSGKDGSVSRVITDPCVSDGRYKAPMRFGAYLSVSDVPSKQGGLELLVGSPEKSVGMRDSCGSGQSFTAEDGIWRREDSWDSMELGYMCQFGYSIANIGDLDGDKNGEVAFGAPDFGMRPGGVTIMLSSRRAQAESPPVVIFPRVAWLSFVKE